MVPKVGVEPTLPEENYALNVARLPIPPLRLVLANEYRNLLWLCQVMTAGNPGRDLARSIYDTLYVKSVEP